MMFFLYRVRRGGQNSSALVMVLLAIVLATVMVLAIMAGAQVERQTAFYYEERTRADALAQSGLDHAVGLLRTTMGGTNQSAQIGPGQIVTLTYPSPGAMPVYSVTNLSSDVLGPCNTNLAGNYAPPNLNAQSLDGTYPIDGGGSLMQVRWIYVYKDGTLSAVDTPTNSATNPLTGRYAFWIDNSSSRINLNTAWTRNGNTNASPMSVSRVTLNAVAGFPTTETQTNAVAANFNSDYDLRTPDIVSAVSTNRYDYTFYNHSSDGLNPFGKPKIYLTTQLANLPPGFTNVSNYTNYFLSILANNSSGSYPAAYVDPGIAANLNDARITGVVNNLYSYLTNTAWPEFPGQSYAGKYWGSSSDPRIYQLAVNIVEYVRAKESQQKIVCAIKGSVSGGVFTSTTVADAGGNQNGLPGAMPLIGVTRTPLITEMGMYWSPGSMHYFIMQTEIYLPPNVGIDSLNATDFDMEHQFECTNINAPTGYANRFWALPYGGGPVSDPGTSTQSSFELATGSSFPLTANNRYAQVFMEQSDGDFGSTTSGVFLNRPPTSFRFWAGIAPVNYPYALSASAPSDFWGPPALASSPGIGPINLTTANIGTPMANSWQIDDPLTGVLSTNWQLKPSTWGATNTGVRTVGQAPSSLYSTQPQQDTDSSGNITDVGWRMPYPYGYVNAAGITPNPSGRMDSLAELGYVNTGGVCWTNSTSWNGVPWRTLRLQPTSASGLPDWALLDLFALPIPSTNFIYQPYSYGSPAGLAVGGRVNPNRLYPFTNTIRATPLMALLYGATNPIAGTTNTLATAGTLATNILQMSLAEGHGSWAAYDSTNGVYAHIGELAEITGMADGGESSEGNLFEPLAQTTTSGNVFTVYTIGQALRQTPTGGIVINGEKRYQAAIEKVMTPNATTGLDPTGAGLFRVVVVRDLTP